MELNEALVNAVISDQPKIVTALLNQGANPNHKQTEEQLTPLHLAALYNAEHVIEPLLKAGADPSATTKHDGITARDIAIQHQFHKFSALIASMQTAIAYA